MKSILRSGLFGVLIGLGAIGCGSHSAPMGQGSKGPPEVYVSTPVTRDIPLKEIDKPILSLDLGVAWDLTMRSQLFAGFTEDVIAESGPDITFNLIWKMQF